MKIFPLILVFGLCAGTVCAQKSTDSLRVSLKGKNYHKLRISVWDASLITVEGYNGDELTIEPRTHQYEEPRPEAAGLKDISDRIGLSPAHKAKSLKDNVRPHGDLLEVLWETGDYPDILIRVPRNINLTITPSPRLNGTNLAVSNMSAGLGVSGWVSSVKINNVSLPVDISVSSGNMGNKPAKIVLSNINWPVAKPETKGTSAPKIYIVSASMHDIDISIPKNMEATFGLTARHGAIYSDLNMTNKEPGNTFPNWFAGELNGGGIPITARTEYGNIFLRKEK